MKVEEIQKVTVILRGYTYEQVRYVVQAMLQTTLKSIEITTNSPDAFNTAKKISEEFKDIYVGIGTVMNENHVEEAIKANVDFILTPVMLDKESIIKCKEKGIVTVVSALTPSEVNKMDEFGADIIKIFPARNVGYDYAKAIKAPLGNHLRLMAVGGVNAENSKEFLKNGYDYVGVGSSMFKKDDVISGNIEKLVASIKEFERVIGEVDGK